MLDRIISLYSTVHKTSINNVMVNSKFANERYFDLTLWITANFDLRCPKISIYNYSDFKVVLKMALIWWNFELTVFKLTVQFNTEKDRKVAKIWEEVWIKWNFKLTVSKLTRPNLYQLPWGTTMGTMGCYRWLPWALCTTAVGHYESLLKVLWVTICQCYWCYGPPWSTAMGTMGCYVLLWATAIGTSMGHYGSLLWVLLAAMGHYYEDYGLLWWLLWGVTYHYGWLLWALWAAMGHCYEHYGSLLWTTAIGAIGHCHGDYGLLWTRAMGTMEHYGPLLWVTLCHYYGYCQLLWTCQKI